MANDMIVITDGKTGQTIEREMTDAEQAERNTFLAQVETETQAQLLAQEQEQAAKQAAQAKLAALGLTTDDLKALGL